MLQTKYGLYGQNNPLFQDLLICSGIYDIKMKTRLSHMIFLLVEAGGGGGVVVAHVLVSIPGYMC